MITNVHFKHKKKNCAKAHNRATIQSAIFLYPVLVVVALKGLNAFIISLSISTASSVTKQIVSTCSLQKFQLIIIIF